MVRQRTKKKLLWILIPAAVVIAAGAALAFWLTREEEPQAYLRDISSYDDITNSVLQVNSPWEWEEQSAPLPRYPSAAPEGYEQLLDSGDLANRFSTSYTDVYHKDGQIVYVEQSYAWNQDEVPLLTYAHFETVEFGGREVFCYTEEDYSGAVWLEGNHLMEVLVYGVMERDDLLAWVAGVDSQNPVEPGVRPWNLFPASIFRRGWMRAVFPAGKRSLPPSAATPPRRNSPPSGPLPRRRKGLPSKGRFWTAGKASISAGSTGMPRATGWSWKTGPFRIITPSTPLASGITMGVKTGKTPAR
ncbi:MAG TPA: hypothetical protein IAD19_02715 [Candidatus Egerieicola faecale]|uniref:DUF4367 domain-containing protein n=1 Tax=Candidatus Egerieicola faecale TaxID=2840774 RepID=A0A9D1LK02_9FIRM|nr:hypothetical protein [Candidatus Egerieicola faecale]